MVCHRIIALIVLLLCSEILISDVWSAKEPTSYTGKGGQYIAEIFPSRSRLRNSKPICFFYREHCYLPDSIANDPQKRFTLLWSVDLVNQTAPNAALVSESGYLVTLDEHAFLGSAHSLVVYGKKGELICDYSLTDLIPKKDIQKNIINSTSS